MRLVQSLRADDIGTETCNWCTERVATHTIYEDGVRWILCCKCFVEDGSAPADWHPLCMQTYDQMVNDGKWDKLRALKQKLHEERYR